MKRMWLPIFTEVTAYQKCDTGDSLTIGKFYRDMGLRSTFANEPETVSPGWVDIDTYPMLEPYCISEHEYKLQRLMGQTPL